MIQGIVMLTEQTYMMFIKVPIELNLHETGHQKVQKSVGASTNFQQILNLVGVQVQANEPLYSFVPTGQH
ncbi:hypothetical protein Hanom_Chr13g01208211 [Helianthus anomalus]